MFSSSSDFIFTSILTARFAKDQTLEKNLNDTKINERYWSKTFENFSRKLARLGSKWKDHAKKINSQVTKSKERVQKSRTRKKQVEETSEGEKASMSEKDVNLEWMYKLT